MKTDLFVPFLKFLSQTADSLQQKPDLLVDEIVSLRRECERFVQQLDGREDLPSSILESARSLRVDIDTRHLDGSRSHLWRFFIAVFTGRPWASGPTRSEIETAMSAVREFRNRVDHILFAIEMR